MYKSSCVSTNVLFTQHIAAHGNEQTPVLRVAGVHSGVHFLCAMSRLDVKQPLRARLGLGFLQHGFVEKVTSSLPVRWKLPNYTCLITPGQCIIADALLVQMTGLVGRW
jgi:hypothetical protein